MNANLLRVFAFISVHSRFLFRQHRWDETRDFRQFGTADRSEIATVIELTVDKVAHDIAPVDVQQCGDPLAFLALLGYSSGCTIANRGLTTGSNIAVGKESDGRISIGWLRHYNPTLT